MKQIKFKRSIFLATITLICLVFISAQPALAYNVGVDIRYPTYDLESNENLYYGQMTNASLGSLILWQVFLDPTYEDRFRVTQAGDIHAHSICNEDGGNCYDISDGWSSVGGDGYIGLSPAHIAKGTLNMNGNAIYGYLLGAVSGAQDSTIWGVSGDYPTWGIGYNEGSTDYIEFKTSGTVTSRISLDTGAADFGLVAGGSVSVGGDITVSGGDIITPAGMKLYPAGGGYVEAKSNNSSYGLRIEDYNSSNYGNIDANDGYLTIGYNIADGPLFINDNDNIGINIAARTDGYKLAISGLVYMSNSAINYASQLHFNGFSATNPGLWLYDNDNNQFLTYKWGNTGAGGINFFDGDGALQGYIYADGGNSNPLFGLLDGDGNWAVWTRKDDYVGFRVDNVDKMRINSAGNVGINTTSIGYRLTVNSTIGTPNSNHPYLVLDSSGAGSNTLEQSAQISIGEHGRGSASLHLSYIGNGYSYIGMGSLGGDNIPDYYAMRFYYLDRNIYMPGNIGIGTSPSSSYKLYVAGGDARVDDVVYLGLNGSGIAYVDGCWNCRGGGVVYAPNLESYNGLWINGGIGTGLYVQNNGGADIDGNVYIRDSLSIGTTDTTTHKIYARDSRGSWAYRFNNDNNGSNIHVAYGGGAGLHINSGTGFSASTRTLEIFSKGVSRMVVTGDGRVGIGTASPDSIRALHVIGNFLVNGTNGYGDANLITAVNLKNTSNNQICGDAAGTFYFCPSDDRLKENIETIDAPIEKLNKLRGVYFDWKKNDDGSYPFGEGRDVGLIAQEVEEVLPEVVKENSDGYKSVNYSRLTGFLIEVEKEQQKQMEKLMKEIEELKIN